jgi:hypothetical protein
LKLEQQHIQVDWESKESSGQVVLRHGPRAQVLLREKELERAYLNLHRTPDKTGEILQI